MDVQAAQFYPSSIVLYAVDIQSRMFQRGVVIVIFAGSQCVVSNPASIMCMVILLMMILSISYHNQWKLVLAGVIFIIVGTVSPLVHKHSVDYVNEI